MSMSRVRVLRVTCGAAAASMLASSTGAMAAQTDLDAGMRALRDARPVAAMPLEPRHATPCVNGFAGIYPCSNIDLLAFVPVANFTAASTNSLWGWTDPQTGTEYALVGANNGIAFFDLSIADHPRYLGKLPTHTGNSLWRDVRTYANHAFVVSDANGAHGMQVFDLTRLRNVTTPQTFTETAFYGQFGKGHTIAINEATGFAYVPGSNTCGTTGAAGGLHMINIQNPAAPTFAGCVTTGGYTHESQCWIYAGPDSQHAGKEICVNANGPTRSIAIVDVTSKSAPVTLSSTTYTGAAYPHQGWLTDDHRYLLVNDELDEQNNGHSGWTYVWDVSDLDAPLLVGHHEHALPAIDHNLYVHGNYVYESNYEAGLRILRMDNLSQAAMTEVAFFDVYPASNDAEFNGTWNNYRFPASGNVIVTSIDEGFFVLAPRICAAQSAPVDLAATPVGDRRIDLAWTGAAAKYRVERAQGGCGGRFEALADALPSAAFSDTTPSGLVDYGYRVIATDASGQCTSTASTCVVAQTTGECTAPPLFSGISDAANAGSATCRVDLGWNAAQAACGESARYSVYRSLVPGFTPEPALRIAADVSTQGFVDNTVLSGTRYSYVVRASDAANGAEDGNRVELTAIPTGLPTDGTFTSGAEPGDPIFDTSEGGGAPSARITDQIRHAGWHLSGSRFHAGTQSFWSTSANNLCVSLVTPPLALSSGQSAQLSFWNVWDVEPGYDGGVVELSTNSGASWTRLTPIGGYPGTIDNGGSLCGIAQGSGAFTGNGQFTWSQARIDLSVYAGQNVQLRWLYRTDAGVVGQGWFVDDIAIAHAQVPGTCTTDVDVIFESGFDRATP